MRAWLRDPLLWFAVAGVALFGGWQTFGHRENRIDLSAAAQAAMASDYAAMAGHQPGEAEKQKLIRREVDDEVLLAEGVRRGCICPTAPYASGLSSGCAWNWPPPRRTGRG
jgi:hypothetical protein